MNAAELALVALGRALNERGYRFVENEKTRLHRERTGDRDSLLLSTGKLRRIFVDMVSQPNAAGIAGATNPGQPIAPSTGAGGTSSGFGASGFGSSGSGFGSSGSGFGSSGSGFGGSNGLGNAFGQSNSSGNSSNQGQDLVRHVRFLRRGPSRGCGLGAGRE